MAARQPPQRPQGSPPQGSQSSQASQPSSQAGKWQQGPSWMEAELRDLLGLWSEEEVLWVMGSKRRNADAFARLAEGLATGVTLPALRTMSGVKSKSWGRVTPGPGMRPANLGPPFHLPFYRELRDILGPRHTYSPLATLDTSAEEPQQAPEPESSLESSSRASAPRVSPDRGSGPTAAPSERLESAGEASVVPETPLGPSLQASPSADYRLDPRWARRRTQQHHTPATDPQMLAIHRRQLEVAEQRLRVEQRCLHLQEWALAWREEAWGAYMETYNRLVYYLAPHAAPAAAVPALSAPPDAPPAAPLVAAPSAVALPPATEGQTADGHLGPAETCRTYLPVCPAPSQPRTGLQPRWGSQPPTPSAGL
ncbi:uncharacterized protein LOC142006946 [Carettochelys insculpta]|uniref:uncharacterized protein LOC142006946 n=1 Tax=Carettochelys insculpta TaxID=44489 RepID=UPI003EBA1B20